MRHWRVKGLIYALVLWYMQYTFLYVHETYRHIDAVIYFKNKKNLTHLPKPRIYLPGLVLINMMQKL